MKNKLTPKPRSAPETKTSSPVLSNSKMSNANISEMVPNIRCFFIRGIFAYLMVKLSAKSLKL